jgi:SAM-dependent methyltransferase
MDGVLYSVEALPVLQNRLYADPADARSCATGDVALWACPATGIVSNARFDPSKVVYDALYNNEQGASHSFRSHLVRVAGLVSRHLDCSELVEIGCGKGTFLELMADRGAAVLGFDPAYEGSDPRIRKEFFAPSSRIRGTGIVVRHVLEHIPDPVSFLGHVRDANAGHGRVYLEVPCLDWILDSGAWFDVFYEHVNYFRHADFERMFGKVVTIERTFGGQYLSVVAELSSLRAPGPAPAPAWPDDFLAGLDRTIQEGRGAPHELVWGAGSKGVIFSLLRQRRGRPIAAAIDIHPGKQHRFLPCTGLPVLDPATAQRRFAPGTLAWVMNPNYADEIRSTAGGHFDVRVMP